ncbi:flavodoxin-dependent (E)-4-hydroxy-3-methylbut-2-enyl-diphosphate synthase [Nocardia brasiliensis]|uniref:flavodoxin-dependent (E)-4-hydroxy-3-methylbut-2-enyl-diphosphate synthase n=1 Tax=Nocardia brasiliensis TaxID=37326 RepID=UPI000E1BA439|nr:flavodoxin-dependent (E)-4-hydroxy-3-methylbut-2-enyl-diphosphate synthase [Nocardia brasiliensis]
MAAGTPNCDHAVERCLRIRSPSMMSFAIVAKSPIPVIAEIARRAAAAAVPIRIGVNAGSLDPRLLAKHGGVTAQALVESALWECSHYWRHANQSRVAPRIADVPSCRPLRNGGIIAERNATCPAFLGCSYRCARSHYFRTPFFNRNKRADQLTYLIFCYQWAAVCLAPAFVWS